MAKVGIMSMQRIINYGSFLQAYGLKSVLEELGHEVCFVDYHVGRPLAAGKEGYGTEWGRKIHKALDAMSLDAPMVQKIQYVLYKKDFAAKYHKILGLSSQPNYQSKLDVLLIGSDEVFNCIQGNLNVGYSPELFGKGHQADRLISYAASFGNTTLEKLKRYGKAGEVGELLKGFDALSVRDENSGKIVRSLTDREPSYHLDPVLIYDFMGKSRQIPDIAIREKYLIVYAYSGRISIEEAGWIRHYAKEKGWKVYAIGGVQRCADRFISCSPFEVLAYFRQAEAVITDTFHGTIFSVITHRRFAVLVRKSIGGSYGNEEKLMDLLERLGLENREVRDIHNVGEVLKEEVNYGKTEEIIKRERQRSLMYFIEDVK